MNIFSTEAYITRVNTAQNMQHFYYNKVISETAENKITVEEVKQNTQPPSEPAYLAWKKSEIETAIKKKKTAQQLTNLVMK